jgi:hypothetical protein
MSDKTASANGAPTESWTGMLLRYTWGRSSSVPTPSKLATDKTGESVVGWKIFDRFETGSFSNSVLERMDNGAVVKMY